MRISFRGNLTIALLSYFLKRNGGKERICISLKDLALCKQYNPNLMPYLLCSVATLLVFNV